MYYISHNPHVTEQFVYTKYTNWQTVCPKCREILINKRIIELDGTVERNGL